MMRPKVTREELLSAQRNELSEHQTYKWLASRTRNDRNREILRRIAEEERGHYQVFKRLTQTDVRPSKPKILWYQLISRVLGLSFGLRLMERGEHVTQRVYSRLKAELPELADVILDEQRHEGELLGLIEEERLQYAGSIVLGLNDALVELTGALAGLTFALRDGRVIAMAGFVTGVAASMSMAASAFLSTREEAEAGGSRKPSKSAAYTGITYIVTVLILILPYLLLGNVYMSLLTMILLSLLIILSYNFYIATAKSVGLWSRFATMAGMSLAVACISFFVGIGARTLFGVEI